MPCACGGKAVFKGMAGKDLITSVGDVRVGRRTYRCKACGAKTPAAARTPFDAWAGLGSDHLTPRARRLAAVAGIAWSFDDASAKLKELCGLRMSDQTIRRACDKAGKEARAWLGEAAAAAPVASAAGRAEMYVDGTMVNTRSGWRELRLVLFAKRRPAAPAEPAQWATRALPETEARLAQAGFTSAEETGALMAATARRAGQERGRGLSVLGDGAKWIWRESDERLPHAEQSLDVQHLSEHLHDAGKAILGEGAGRARGADAKGSTHTPDAKDTRDAKGAANAKGAKAKDSPSQRFAQEHLMGILTDGAGHLMRWLVPALQQARDAAAAPSGPAAPGQAPGSAAPGQAQDAGAAPRALRELLAYLWPNRHRIAYAERLRRGLPIGTGMVEGACKTIAGRRLKLNSARWLPERAEHMAALRCLDYSGQWGAYWAKHAA